MEYISNYEVTTCHSREKNWLDLYDKETRNLFRREDKWRTWVIYKHHRQQQTLGKALGEI